MTKTMYDAVNGTEYTTIVANVTTVATTINLTDVDVLPSATNILHLYKVDSDGIITDWERCKFTAIVDPSVTISRSGDEHSSSDNGNAIAFSSGDRVARFISGWDLNALNENVAENTIEIATKIGTSDTKTLTNKTIDADSNTISNIGSSEVSSNLITGQDALGETVDDADYLLLYDTSGNSLKKVLISNLPPGGDVATDAIWDAKGDMAMGTGADTAQKLTVGANGTVLTADSTETTGTKWATPDSGSSSWTEVTAFTATPASTSTITTTSDLTGTITKRDPLRYVIGGVTYYGIVTVITSSLITIAGAPLSSTITALHYGDPTRVKTDTIVVNGYYADASNSKLIESDLFMNDGLIWTNSKAYIVQISYLHAVNDSGATQPKINITNGGSDIITSDVSVSTSSTVRTGININTYYLLSFGGYIEIDVTKGTNGDAHDLTVYLVAVFP